MAVGRSCICSASILFLFLFCCRSSCHPSTFLFGFCRVLSDGEVAMNINELDLYLAICSSWMKSTRHLGLQSSTRTTRYFTSRIPYTPNSVSTFNVTRLRLATSGDINPNPGPSITSFTTNRFRQRHEMQRRRNPCNLVQIKCDSYLHLKTSTTNLTMSGLEVKSGTTDRVWPIDTVESRRTFPSKVKNLHNAVNKNNLVQICITSNRKPVISNKSTLSAPKFCLFGLLNCRSVRNKYLSIKDYVVDKDFDIFAITETRTETWLNTGDYDNLVIGSLIPNGYRFLHSARDGRGGGVGLLFKSSLPVKQTSKVYLDTFISFEAIECEVKIFSQSVSILIVYRPPPSSGNNLSTELFMNEFSSLLEYYITKTGSLIITGDFNFHVDDTTNTAAANFLSLLESFDLQQHVRSCTHRAGHTLDLVITRDAEYIF